MKYAYPREKEKGNAFCCETKGISLKAPMDYSVAPKSETMI